MDGREVPSSSQQQWVTRGGTALAFLTKVLLVVATSIAYTQLLFLRVSKESFTLRRLDSMFPILSNAMEFLLLRVWLTRPLLALPAIITWLYPIAAIVTPGTIVVQPALHQPAQPDIISQRDFVNGAFGLLGSTDNTTVSIFSAPNLDYVISPMLQNSDIATIPRDDQPTNVTYSTSFHGPAVSCAEADSTTSSFVERAALEWENSVQAYMDVTAFIPQPGFGPMMDGSFSNLSNVSPDNGGSASTVFQIDTFSTDRSRLYLRMRADKNTSALISCSFYNTSYTVRFDLRSNGQQIVTTNVSFADWLNARGFVDHPPQDPIAGNTTLSFFGLVSAFGGKMVGRRISAYDPTLLGTTSMAALVYSLLMSAYAYNANNTSGLTLFVHTVESLMQNFTIGTRSERKNLVISQYPMSWYGWTSFKGYNRLNCHILSEPILLLAKWAVNRLWIEHRVGFGLHTVGGVCHDEEWRILLELLLNNCTSNWFV